MLFSPWRILLILCPILRTFRPILFLIDKISGNPKTGFPLILSSLCRRSALLLLLSRNGCFRFLPRALSRHMNRKLRIRYFDSCFVKA